MEDVLLALDLLLIFMDGWLSAGNLYLGNFVIGTLLAIVGILLGIAVFFGHRKGGRGNG